MNKLKSIFAILTAVLFNAAIVVAQVRKDDCEGALGHEHYQSYLAMAYVVAAFLGILAFFLLRPNIFVGQPGLGHIFSLFAAAMATILAAIFILDPISRQLGLTCAIYQAEKHPFHRLPIVGIALLAYILVWVVKYLKNRPPRQHN